MVHESNTHTGPEGFKCIYCSKAAHSEQPCLQKRKASLNPAPTSLCRRLLLRHSSRVVTFYRWHPTRGGEGQRGAKPWPGPWPFGYSVNAQVQVGSSPRSRATAKSLRSRSAGAIAALGLSQQEESEAGHLGRALRGTLWGALGCRPFKRRLARPLGLLAGHLAWSSVHLKPNTNALWSY